MKKIGGFISLFCVLLALSGCRGWLSGPRVIVLKGIDLIDGTGRDIQRNVNMVIRADTIAAIQAAGDPLPDGARIINGKGRTVIPGLINAHGHLGLLNNDSASASHYNKANIIRQLKKYASYGVTGVLSLGTDQDLIFALRDSSQKGLLPGAILYTAGYGFGVTGGVPPVSFGNKIMRPHTPEEAAQDMRALATLKPDFVKIWVDNAGQNVPRIAPAVYQAIIQEAHRHGLRVAAHVYYLEDARRLVQSGVDVLAHSVRDQEIDDTLVAEMKQKGVFYIPTLSLDKYNLLVTDNPAWINDPFFRTSLEPNVIERITSETFREKQRNDSTLPRKKAAFETAKRNVQKLHKAGITIVLGTDSGAQPIRAQGFSEHLELQLLTEAGLTPMEAIVAATRNAAKMLGIDKQYGTLEPGKKANFVVLDGNPLQDIQQTHRLDGVWKYGKRIN
jgi:imidazolonepropionase-like amidohydrolase